MKKHNGISNNKQSDAYLLSAERSRDVPEYREIVALMPVWKFEDTIDLNQAVSFWLPAVSSEFTQAR